MTERNLIVKEIELKEAIVGQRADGICHVYFKPRIEITVELQYQLLEAYRKLLQGETAPFIFEPGEFCTISRAAKENAKSLELQSPVSASVILVNNLGHKLLADFYYKFTKPRKPYMVVWKFQKGLDWIKKQQISLSA